VGQFRAGFPVEDADVRAVRPPEGLAAARTSGSYPVFAWRPSPPRLPRLRNVFIM
jgi:hypothetical protein